MPRYAIDGEERRTFRECRRRWDLGSPNRRSLQPTSPPPLFDLATALRAGLAVYYYPGMWDWPRQIVLPLVAKGYERSMTEQRDAYADDAVITAGQEEEWASALEHGHHVLDRYVSWAPSADHFSPVRVEAEFEAGIPDPTDSSRQLATDEGTPIVFAGTIDAIVIDEYDAYWVLRHRVVDEWSDPAQAVLDDASVAACWGWEDFYLGMEMSGTILTEIRVPGPSDASDAPGGAAASIEGPKGELPRAGIPQHEASGGGRSVPQHRRLYASSQQPDAPPRLLQQEGPDVRRTWVRRGRGEVSQAAAYLGREVVEMLDPDLAVYPSPSPAHCASCPYLDPCQVLNEGGDPIELLTTRYRRRVVQPLPPGRLGSSTWGVGRTTARPPDRWRN